MGKEKKNMKNGGEGKNNVTARWCALQEGERKRYQGGATAAKGFLNNGGCLRSDAVKRIKAWGIVPVVLGKVKKSHA